ncbi:hypothetical protein CRG98_023584 [Punica granatum]|uniref:Uncharacterized protein n=1 Tax=Punica granatum TaxID=22663 RepID=A0A2I0JIE9_PUNGR|nr:hypothetical protein CRG98_023584 [Punica granatum]
MVHEIYQNQTENTEITAHLKVGWFTKLLKGQTRDLRKIMRNELLTPHIKQISKNLASLSRRGVLPSLRIRGKSRRSGKGSWETRLERTDPNRCSRVDWQTRLAVWLAGAVPVDRDRIFARGQLRWIPKRLRIASAVVSGGEHA